MLWWKASSRPGPQWSGALPRGPSSKRHFLHSGESVNFPSLEFNFETSIVHAEEGGNLSRGLSSLAWCQAATVVRRSWRTMRLSCGLDKHMIWNWSMMTVSHAHCEALQIKQYFHSLVPVSFSFPARWSISSDPRRVSLIMESAARLQILVLIWLRRSPFSSSIGAKERRTESDGHWQV